MSVVLPVDLGARLQGVFDPVPDGQPALPPAAVVALILGGEDTPSLLLIERASDLTSHPGQLAFPGGKPEADDRDLLHTALREAEEEVGLPTTGARVLGRLHPVPTPRFLITPFVVRPPSGWEPTIRSPEVSRLLTPTLESLVRPGIHRVAGVREIGGRRHLLHEFRIHEPPLWGATARMVWDLLDRVAPGVLGQAPP